MSDPPPAYVASDGSVIHPGDHLRDICGLVWTARKVLPSGCLEIELEVVFYGVRENAVMAARGLLPPGASVLRYDPATSG